METIARNVDENRARGPLARSGIKILVAPEITITIVIAIARATFRPAVITWVIPWRVLTGAVREVPEVPVGFTLFFRSKVTSRRTRRTLIRVVRWRVRAGIVILVISRIGADVFSADMG